MAISTLTAGANGLATFRRRHHLQGLARRDVDGRVKLSAQKSRLATIYADRTRLDGDYHLGISDGHVRAGRRFCRRQRDARPVDARRRDAAARGRGQDPDRAGRRQHRQCDQPHGAQLQRRRARSASSISPAAARRGSTDADVIGPGGARARVFGGSGVTYYWPSGGLRIDGNIEMARRRTAERRE